MSEPLVLDFGDGPLGSYEPDPALVEKLFQRALASELWLAGFTADDLRRVGLL